MRDETRQRRLSRHAAIESPEPGRRRPEVEVCPMHTKLLIQKWINPGAVAPRLVPVGLGVCPGLPGSGRG